MKMYIFKEQGFPGNRTVAVPSDRIACICTRADTDKMETTLVIHTEEEDPFCLKMIVVDPESIERIVGNDLIRFNAKTDNGYFYTLFVNKKYIKSISAIENSAYTIISICGTKKFTLYHSIDDVIKAINNK